MHGGKVFGIGFHKTSTTSLANALYTLGYNVTGYFGNDDPMIAEHALEEAFRRADRYDAAQDTPWPVLYKALDERYPGSKFVLTVRDTAPWVNSVVNHFGDRHIHAHEWIYGVPTASGNEAVYAQRYEQHNAEVLEYFAGRDEDLLVMDITQGHGWERLCPFLGVPVPGFPFPSQNAAKRRKVEVMRRLASYILHRYLSAGKNMLSRRSRDYYVNAIFLRDLVHYHYRAYEPVIQALETISRDQFTDRDEHHGSVCDILMKQWQSEGQLLAGLRGENRSEPLSDDDHADMAPGDLTSKFRDRSVAVRRYAADLTDEACLDPIPRSRMLVWEALLGMVTAGIERRDQVVHQLLRQGIEVRAPSFPEVFGRHRPLGRQPAEF